MRLHLVAPLRLQRLLQLLRGWVAALGAVPCYCPLLPRGLERTCKLRCAINNNNSYNSTLEMAWVQENEFQRVLRRKFLRPTPFDILPTQLSDFDLSTISLDFNASFSKYSCCNDIISPSTNGARKSVTGIISAAHGVSRAGANDQVHATTNCDCGQQATTHYDSTRVRE
jgi:hypothetical protein